jgi:DNA invertase Pin-like site-specific DNA recombinase
MKVGYARVSSKTQDVQRQIDAHERVGVDRIVTEKKSGDSDKPALSALLEELVAGDALVVDDLDRLSRSMRELLNIVHDLETREISLYVGTRLITTSTVAGFMEVALKGFSAELQLRQIRQNVAKGIASARKHGVAFGRKRAMKPSQRDEAILMLRCGRTKREVADLFGIGRATVYRLIEDGVVDELERGLAPAEVAAAFNVKISMVERIIEEHKETPEQ